MQLSGPVNDGAKFEDIPTPLQGVNHYRPETDDGYQAFYRRAPPKAASATFGQPGTRSDHTRSRKVHQFE
jgi:hypothetical protein